MNTKRRCQTLVLVLVFVPVSWACGPFFYNWLLDGSDGDLLRSPVLILHDELNRLQLIKSSRFTSVPPADGYRKQTMDAELADLREALLNSTRSPRKGLWTASAWPPPVWVGKPEHI